MRGKILVVDDDQGILDGFEVMLESEGYAIETSPYGEKLQHLSKDNLPDLIILDVLLSGKDGRELCKELKRNKLTKNTPLIMISAHPNVKKSALAAGANEYLNKPFEMEALLKLVAKYVKPQMS